MENKTFEGFDFPKEVFESMINYSDYVSVTDGVNVEVYHLSKEEKELRDLLNKTFEEILRNSEISPKKG